MNEKLKVRLWSVPVFLLMLLGMGVSSYLIVDEFFWVYFLGLSLAPVVIEACVLLRPESFTSYQIRERQRAWRRNRSGRILLLALLGTLVFSLVSLFLISYLSGYRMM